MKHFSTHIHLTLFALFVFTLSSCTIDSFESNRSILTDEELRVTGQIIGESVSENDSGLLSSFAEAFAIPTSNGLATGNSVLATGSFRNLNDYSYEYISAQGAHQVQFSRTDAMTGIPTQYDLKYIFRDSDGNFIESPNQNSHLIESLEFEGQRTGEIETVSKSSTFNRTDRLILDGLSDQSPILSLDGSHTGEGLFIRNDATGQIQREYLVDLNFLDVKINKETIEQIRSFRKGVTGALSYESTIRSNQTGSDTEAKIVNGTLEFNGDGTALLKFRDVFETYRIRLESGEVFDDDEFEGRIVEVDLQQNIFTISNGQKIQINSETKIDDDSDFQSLDEVVSAMESGVRIEAEGEYYKPDENVNLWIAGEVEFENEGNEFEEFVENLNLADSSLTLNTGEIFYFNAKTDLEFDDDFNSLEDVIEALNLNLPVYAEGDFYVDPETERFILTEVDFELEMDEFEELVQSVDIDNQVITLINGQQILITEETLIEQDDFNSLEEVAAALDAGISVEADGDYYYNSAEAIWIVYSIKFEEDSDSEED